jgi:hypothetical protein
MAIEDDYAETMRCVWRARDAPEVDLPNKDRDCGHTLTGTYVPRVRQAGLGSVPAPLRPRTHGTPSCASNGNQKWREPRQLLLVLVDCQLPLPLLFASGQIVCPPGSRPRRSCSTSPSRTVKSTVSPRTGQVTVSTRLRYVAPLRVISPTALTLGPSRNSGRTGCARLLG